MKSKNRLTKTLLGAGLAVALGFALLTSMGQAQAGVIADARGDFVPGINIGDPGILLPATGTGTWNYLASDTANPTSDPNGLDVMGWNLPPFSPANQYIWPTTSGSATSVSLLNANLTAEEILVHPSWSIRPPAFAVVRWISGVDEAGLINIAGTFRRLDLAGGGGVTFQIFVDGISIISATRGAGNASSVLFGHSLTVGAGSTVDFVIGPNGDDAHDSTALKATITSLVRNVTIDIKPGSDPNSINLCSMGVIPVAILSSATFDVSTITDAEIAVLRLGDANVKMVGKAADRSLCSIKDVNDDGFDDLVCKFLTVELVETDATVELTVFGENGGVAFEGTDSVNIAKDDCD